MNCLISYYCKLYCRGISHLFYRLLLLVFIIALITVKVFYQSSDGSPAAKHYYNWPVNINWGIEIKSTSCKWVDQNKFVIFLKWKNITHSIEDILNLKHLNKKININLILKVIPIYGLQDISIQIMSKVSSSH